jgi:hypothetical protein
VGDLIDEGEAHLMRRRNREKDPQDRHHFPSRASLVRCSAVVTP